MFTLLDGLYVWRGDPILLQIAEKRIKSLGIPDCNGGVVVLLSDLRKQVEMVNTVTSFFMNDEVSCIVDPTSLGGGGGIMLQWTCSRSFLEWAAI